MEKRAAMAAGRGTTNLESGAGRPVASWLGLTHLTSGVGQREQIPILRLGLSPEEIGN